ncbi:VIN3-like protein 2 [Prosopis cineraria]|uniref:VIN3-like protein 2 n=1 Tax=Prosopis cineraria TaxID=364024 RepID=UPI0024108A4D|nr:VIN3-like protein 2 [Prosopis cineraria]
MDSSLEGVLLDPSKCSKLSMEEKRELIYEISKSQGASEMLQSWSRQEILKILCAEMGKERKYTGLTKLKIIENLLKIVSEKKSGGQEITRNFEPPLYPPANGQKPAKRQRKTENPSRLPLPANNGLVTNGSGDLGSSTTCCKNSACKATLSQADVFCKRCSCCICYQYDDNKDPSLWLICNSDPPFRGVSCGLSCHLECAIKHDGSGIGKNGVNPKLDGGFYCHSCGKANDLLGCCRKQLSVAKCTRRVDILCYRVSLTQRLLQGTEKYKKLYELINEAVKKLEPDVGPLTGSPVKIGRGIVNRLSSGPEVQKFCGFALELLDSSLSEMILPRPSPSLSSQDTKLVASDMVRFEDVTATSLTVVLGSENSSGENIVGYSLWHRAAHDVDYPLDPICTLHLPDRRFSIRDLIPSTEYIFKVVVFNHSRELGTYEVHVLTEQSEEEAPNCSTTERSQSPVTNCSSLSNPSSVEDETNNSNPFFDQTDNKVENHLDQKDTDKLASGILSNDATNCPNNGEFRLPTDADSLSDKEHAAGTGSDVLKLDEKHSPEDQVTEDMSTDNGPDSPTQTGRDCVPLIGSSEAGLPNTPCKLEMLKDDLGRKGRPKSSGKAKDQENGPAKRQGPQDGSKSKNRNEESQQVEERDADGFSSDGDFEYYVKVIRRLECEGHIEKNFRQKFLTWYSLRATPQEVRVVKVYIDTFIEDPLSLAEQLVDTFSDCISSKRTSMVPPGFCMKLWH